MKNLFTEARRLDEKRSVNVTELADTSIIITGITSQLFQPATVGSIRLSPEALEQIRQILNNWRKCNPIPDELDNCPFLTSVLTTSQFQEIVMKDYKGILIPKTGGALESLSMRQQQLCDDCDCSEIQDCNQCIFHHSNTAKYMEWEKENIWSKN